MEPTRKFVVLVLWTAQQDRAAELVIEEPIANGTVPIRYLVDGRWYNMTPFPEHIRQQVARTIIEMAGDCAPVQFPWQGEINLRVTEAVRLRWSVRFTSLEGCIRLRRPVHD